MAQTTRVFLYSSGSEIIKDNPDHNTYDPTASNLFSFGAREGFLPLCKFKVDADFDQYKYRKIYNARVYAYCAHQQFGNGTFALYSPQSLSSEFDPQTVTWNTAPGIDDFDTLYIYDAMVTGSLTSYQLVFAPNANVQDGSNTSKFAKNALRYGVAFVSKDIPNMQRQGYYVRQTKTGDGAGAPWVVLSYDDAEDVLSTVKASGKSSEYVNPSISNSFNWFFDKVGIYYCYGDWTQASAVFHWRSGTSGSWNDIPATGSAQSVTVPANTFPRGTIQWYVSAVDNTGTASDSPVYTISTADSLTTATPISPIGTVEDGNGDITITWTEANDNGTTPTGADLQYSQDGETWTQFGHVDGAVTTYTAPGGTFPAGSILWRVRAYNADAVAGPWSEAANFVSVAAPGAPIVSAAAVPFTTITWQSSGQQAYRITIDGVTYGPFFGTVKSYTPRDYLRDGIHTISVEIQGVYGLWSQAGSVTFTVANAPGDGITLTGSFNRDAALSWATASATADFLVYRDDKQIAATSVTGYTDRFVLGAHSYQVINRLPNGNYTASNVVNGVMRSCTTAIAPFNGGAWQELKLSENSYSEQRFSWARLSSTRHVTGAVYPVIEVSEYEDAAGSYDVSFPDVASANAFLALRGQIVILKSRGGNVVIGALAQIEQANKDFYISFAFTIQRIDWEDYVDAQNS